MEKALATMPNKIGSGDGTWKEEAERGGPETESDLRRLVFLGAASLSLLAVVPVLAARHLPLLDAPGHEARLSVLHDLLIAGRPSPFYELGSFFLPNIAFDAIGLGLVSVAGPEGAGRIFFALTLVLTLWGILALNRVAIGRWSAVPLASSLLLYNLISILGFFSYLFGLALVPWALALRLKWERGPMLGSFLAGAGAGVILLFCHVFAFGVYAAMSAGFALTALARRRIGVARLILWGLELVPATVIFFAMPTGGAGRIRWDPHIVQSKLFGIGKSVTSGSMAGDAAFLVGLLALVLLIAACSRVRLTLSFVPGLIALVILYLILPFGLASGYYVDTRMPIAIALLLLAGIDVRIRRSRPASALAGLIVAALMVKQGALAASWRAFEPLIDEAVAALDALPAGSIILQSECQPESGDIPAVYRERQPPMTHLAAFASFDGTRFAAGTWAIAGQQPVAVKPAYRPYYDLQLSFGPSTCTDAGYRAELQGVRDLAGSRDASGNPPPLYFLLIRPPKHQMLAADARMIAEGRDFDLYTVEKP